MATKKIGVNMLIELHGLTEKQMALCDIMWAIETMEGVDSFISTLPINDQRTCRNLIELMRLSAIDNSVEDFDDVSVVLKKIKGDL
jgi:hypothetical protein